MKRIFQLLPVFLMVTTAQAANFDCTKASTKVEKMICSNAELSKLDEDLNAAYQSAMQDESQAKTVRRVQKEWLKDRNSCANITCLKTAYETRVAQLQLGENARITKGADNPICTKVEKGNVSYINFDLMHALIPDSTTHQSYGEGLARADIDNKGQLENVVKVYVSNGPYETTFLATTDDSRTRILDTTLNKSLAEIGAGDLFILNGVTFIDIKGGDIRTIYKVEHENANLMCEFQRYTSFSEGR